MAIDRSSTSDWMVASVTSTMAVLPPAAGAPLDGPPCGGVPGRELAGAGPRSVLRSTAPRVKIDEVIRGSLMVT